MLKNPLPNAKLDKWPKGNIYQFFGENIDLYMQAVGIRGHNGIDIATFEGDTIVAAHDGIIVKAFQQAGGYGKQVHIVGDKDENGIMIHTIYAHLKDISVVEKQRVSTGQSIGTEGNTGFVISGGTAYWNTAPAGKGVHLHFGVSYFVDLKPNTYQYSFGNEFSYSAIDGFNGVGGYIDPMELLKTMKLKLVKEKDRNAVYAIIRGNYYWISPEAMIDLVGDGFADWKDVEVVDMPIQLDRVIK